MLTLAEISELLECLQEQESLWSLALILPHSFLVVRARTSANEKKELEQNMARVESFVSSQVGIGDESWLR